MIGRALAHSGSPLPAGVRARFARGFADAPSVHGTDASGARSVGGWLVSRPDSPAELRADEAANRASSPSGDTHAGQAGPGFDSVRVHDDRSAARAANALGARAFTFGEDIFFGAGQYQPSSSEGRDLIGHELAHVLQARESGPVIMRQVFGEVDKTSPEYLRGYNDGRANNASAPGPLSAGGLADYDAGYKHGLAEATNAQKSLPAVTAVHEVEPPEPPRLGLSDRLRMIVETGPAARSRLDEIILYGGPMPDTTKRGRVVAAAIVDIDGYDGPKEIRAINGADTDGLGAGAPVYHASTPTARQLSATQGRLTEKGGREASILGPRKESIFPHLNDAEMKIFEYILSRVPEGARGTIHFTTVKIGKGETVPVPVEACAGCIRASFESAGILVTVDYVSHAPTFTPLSGDPFGQSHAGEGEHDEPSVKPPPAGTPAAGEHEQATVAAEKPGAVADVEPPGAVSPVETTSVSKATASVPHEMGIHFATGAAGLVLGLLAARLKARVDEKQAKKQIDAYLEVARKKINANPDAALKKMMVAPETTVYAWIPLESSVITTVGVDITSPEPVMSDSSPLFDLGTIDYQFGPIPKELADSFPSVSSFGGSHFTMAHTITIDVPLQTPPIEEIIDYAKARNLPLDDLLVYANGRYQAALSSLQTGLDARQGILAAQQGTADAFQKLQAQFKIAQRLHNVELQKRIAGYMTSVAKSMTSGTDRLKPIDEGLQRSNERLQYWEHILDLIRTARPGLP